MGNMVSADAIPVLISEEVGLSVGDLIELAKEKDKQDILNDFEIEFALDNLEDAEKVAQFNNYGGGGRLETLFRMTKVHVDMFKAEAEVKLAEMQKEHDEYAIVTDVYDLLYDVKLAEISLDQNEAYLDYLEMQYNADVKRYEMGMISLLDLNNSQNSYRSQVIAVSEAENNLNQSWNALKSKIGYEFETELVLDFDVEKLEFDKLYSLVLAEKTAMKDISLYNTYKTYYANDLLFKLTDDAYEPYDKEYKTAYYDAEIGRINYEDGYDSFIINMKSDFNTLIVLEMKIDIKELYLEIGKRNLEIAEQKYELGMISQAELLLEKSRYIQDEYNYKNSIVTYNKSVLEIEELIAE